MYEDLVKLLEGHNFIRFWSYFSPFVGGERGTERKRKRVTALFM